MFVKLYTPDGTAFEITPTIDISSHGARLETRKRWAVEKQLLVRSIRGNLYSSARVAYCHQYTDHSYVIGLELHFPTGDWAAADKITQKQ